ncbi:MAG: histidine phosphatase family protein [Wenzhouxiangellaceae bacterium]|nr:histidine phosphatase family protein [Wenzhouxiangellaceae bacterium]
MSDIPENSNRARTVWLIRHAKAAAPEAVQEDFDRRLTSRGERQCAALRDWLQPRLGNLTATALYSPAARARRTAELALGDWFAGPCRKEVRIWNATAQELAALVEENAGDHLVLVGHNPGLEQLQAALSGQLMPMPTGGAFELQFGNQGRVRLAERFQPDT